MTSNNVGVVKKLGIIFIIFIILSSNYIGINPIKANEHDWVLDERGSDYELFHSPQNPSVKQWRSSPIWIHNGTEYVPYIYQDNYVSDGYYQVQSGLIGVRIYDYYAEFYSPDMNEIRLHSEIWEVERWSPQGQGSWSGIGAQSGSPIFSFSQGENEINITKSFESWAGTFDIIYTFKEGAALKHTVSFKSLIFDETTYRVKQQWTGIVGNKVHHENGIDTLTTATEFRGSYYRFLKNDGSLSVFENQWGAIAYLDPVIIDTHAQGMKVDFIFSNWTLSQGENLEIDPATSTLNNPTEDGYIQFNLAAAYARNNSEDLLISRFRPTFFIRRPYVEWNVSSIDNSALVLDTVFKYEGQFQDSDAHIHDLLQARPSTTADDNAGNLQIYTDIGNGTVYADVAGFPVAATNQEIDLGTTADSDLETAITSTDWFAIGWHQDNESAGDHAANVRSEEFASTPDPTLFVTFTINANPTITSAEISDREDTDNLYAMKKFYTFIAVVNDANGSDTIDKVYLQGKNGAAVIFEVRATDLTGTPTFTIQTGATIINLNTGGSSWVENGEEGTATFSIQPEWDITQLDDGEIAVFVEDDVGGSAGFTDMQNNYFDIITRLVTINYASTDGRVDLNTATTHSGSVRYSLTTSGNTESSSFPPDAQFTSVDIHNSTHAQQATDGTIVNGAFSMSVTVPNAVQSNTYHIYLNLVPDYTDADAPDGDTVAVIGDRIKILTLTSNATGVLIGDGAEIRVTAELEFDSHALGSGDTFFIENTNFTWDGGDSRFEANVSKATAQSIMYNTFNNGSEATFGITVGNMDGNTVTVTWSNLFTTSVTITNIEAGDYIFASTVYLFEAVYSGGNDTFKVAFDDGITFINMSYDRPALSWTLDSGSGKANLLTVTFSETGNTQTVTFRVFLLDTINDVLDRDIHMWVNNTLGDVAGWDERRTNFLNIYNQGGLTESSTVGGGFRVAGGNIFSMAVQSNTTSDFVRLNVTWRKFQHVSFKVSVFQNSSWDAGNSHSDCISEHSDTVDIEYGVDYAVSGAFIEGWKVKIFVVDGDAGNAGNDRAWVRLNVTWYNRGSSVKTDLIYAFYEAHNINDGNTQFSLWVDLWVDIMEGSSRVGGRVSPVFFGMREQGWGPWANWGPMPNSTTVSLYSDDLLDSSSAILASSQIGLFNVWASLNKTDGGAATPSCNTHQWSLGDYDIFGWSILGVTQPMIGIDTPTPNLPRTPDIGAPGLFSSITLAISLMTKQIVNAILQGATVTSFAIASIIDSAFQFFGIDNFIGLMTSALTSLGARFSLAISNVTTIIITVYTFIAASVTWFGTTLSNFVSMWVNIASIMGNIMDGTYGGQGVDWWSLLNFNDWSGNFLPMVITLYWFSTVDQRAKQQGGNWINILWGDTTILLGMTSFFIDMFFTLINFVISSVFNIMNALDIAARRIFGS